VINLKRKLFSQDALREWAAITVALNSWPLDRSTLFLKGKSAQRPCNKGEAQGAVSDRVKEPILNCTSVQL
jgi:hypothetical protein